MRKIEINILLSNQAVNKRSPLYGSISLNLIGHLSLKDLVIVQWSLCQIEY